MRIHIIALTLTSGLAISAAFAGPNDMDDLIVIDHQPVPVGGSGSDTLYRNNFGETIFQRVADNFELVEAATIGSIRWWGFYNEDNPPVEETFRIRFYESRISDGLPDESNIIHEATVNNPSRMATGETVFVGVDPDEYLFETELQNPVSLYGDVTYWLEVTQIGDIDTHFRWEFSQTRLDGRAINNAIVPDWATTSTISDTAYQLIAVPEPASALILFIYVPFVRRSRRKVLQKAKVLQFV